MDKLPTVHALEPAFMAQALMPDKSFREISLAEYNRQGKWVVLLFFSLNVTSVCSSELIAFSDAAENFDDLNTVVLAASCGNKHDQLAWINTPRSEGGPGDMKIPLLVDFDKKIAISYGVELDGDDTDRPLRGIIIISPEGILHQITVKDIPVGRSVDETLRFVHAFVTDDHDKVCPANWKPETSVIGGRKHTAPSSSFGKFFANLGTDSWRLFTEYRLLVGRKPIQTKAITSLIMAIIGELIGGAIIAKQNKKKYTPNLKRVCIFGLYGFVITGPVLHYWYQLLEYCTTKMNLKSFAKTIVKLIIDRGLFGPPFVLLTVSFIQFLQHLSFHKGWEAVRRSYVAILISNQQFWIIAQSLNFGVVPVDMQLLFVNIASIAWNTLLSLAS